MTLSPFVARARDHALPASDLTGQVERTTFCTTLACGDPATATVLVGATRLPKCFTHEREYADRYGSSDIRPLYERSA